MTIDFNALTDEEIADRIDGFGYALTVTHDPAAREQGQYLQEAAARLRRLSTEAAR